MEQPTTTIWTLIEHVCVHFRINTKKINFLIQVFFRMTNYSEILTPVIESLIAAGSDGNGGILTKTKRKLLELILVRVGYIGLFIVYKSNF